jgi:PKD repeat protein
MKKYSVLFIAFVVISSCKREEYPEPVVSVPQFKMTGTLNSQPFELSAGVNNIYLDANTVQNEFGVYELQSKFNDLSCSGCEPVLSILLNEIETLEPGTPCSGHVLENGPVFLATQDNTSDFLEVHFHAPNQPGNNYSWNFGDSSTGSGHDPNHIYSNPGTYEVTLTIDGDDDHSVITQSVIVGSSMFLSMPFQITNLPGGEDEDEWELSYPNNLPYYLEITNWTINGEVYTGNHLHFEDNNTVEVCLHFHNSILNEDGYYCVEFDGASDEQINDFFSYQWEAQDLNIGKAEFRYRNNAGEIFTSITSLNNNSNSTIQITSVEDYTAGIDGSSAKKVNAKFSLWMVNVIDPTDIIHFENVSATLGFVLE